ncbi:MAG: hypothetical protein ACXWTN_09470 [Methylosarcina sp.]
MNYRLVRQSQKEAIPVQHCCRFLGMGGAGLLCGAAARRSFRLNLRGGDSASGRIRSLGPLL